MGIKSQINHKKVYGKIKNVKMDTPILLIIFNRPNLTLQVIDALRKIKPSKMYVAADGPREQKIGEKQLCEETRKTISTIDWPCQIQTNFQAKNFLSGNAALLFHFSEARSEER